MKPNKRSNLKQKYLMMVLNFKDNFMKKIYIYSLALVVLVGCGGGTGSSEPDQKMIIDEIYTVDRGDKIVKTSESAILYISHIDGQSESTVELQSGEATILH